MKAIVSDYAIDKYKAEFIRVPTGVIPLDQFSFVPITGTAFSSAITGVGEIYSCLPRLTQGIGEAQRIGNKIRPTSLKVNGKVCLAQFQDIGSYDITFHMYFMTSKNVKNLANYTSIPIQSFFRDGNGSHALFNGTLQNTLMPMNTADFTVLKHKKMRFKKVYGYNNSTLNGIPGGGNGHGYPDDYLKDFSVSIKCPTLTYDTASAEYPTNFAPFMVCGWVQNDQTGQNAPSPQRICAVMAKAHLYFDNA